MSTDTAPQRTEETNKAVVTEFMEVFSRGDVEAILAFLTDDATWWVAGTIDGIRGRRTRPRSARCWPASRRSRRRAPSP